jgi:hypothetical protein
MASPIQIVLNPDNYHTQRETAGGGPGTDFFAYRDPEFAAHKTRLAQQLRDAAQTLRKQPQTEIGYLKVVLRRAAWAKSHRPLDVLFKPTRTPLVGGEDLGVMLVEVDPEMLIKIAQDVERAEPETRLRYNEQRGREIPYPTSLRSEVGAIDRVELHGPADRRNFSLEEAVAWLSEPVTGSAYVVELFEVPPPRNTWDVYFERKRDLYSSFVDGLARSQRGLTVQLLRGSSRGVPSLAVRIEQSTAPVALVLSQTLRERTSGLVAFDADPKRHKSLLSFLDNHPLVRSISLPAYLMASHTATSRSRPNAGYLPTKDPTKSYPKMGIIDGGISNVLSDWLIGRWDLLADSDSDLAHGTFIGGLAVAAKHFNTEQTCADSDGMDLMDVAVFPSVPGAFSAYYPEGVPQFFDEMETAVADARARHNVRVFNMSLNIVQPVSADRYSLHAARLDQIADSHDALLFISAGNLNSQDLRPEWPVNSTTALAHLAAARNDGMLMPAESIRNIAVAAINPPGDPSKVTFAPTRYSRRGPGLRAGNKPDLAHVGGFGSNTGPLGHGLFSVAPDGTLVDGCGTSYATPLVAKTAAALDHAIEGDVSRETLIGLLVHNASVPVPLLEKPLHSSARHLVGFGVPQAAHEILQTGDHEITLVFATRVKAKQQINFNFNWPASLVGTGGKCRGRAKLTVVASPPLDQRFGAEFVRVNIFGALQQEQENGGWKGKLDPLYLPGGADSAHLEAELIEHGFKWSPVKVYEKSMPKGVGKSSNWRLALEYLTRAGEQMPEEGVPFTAILTISDIDKVQPIFNEMRQTLTAIGVKVADIRTAARISPRV